MSSVAPRPRYLVFGLGQTGQAACRLLLDQGDPIVGAYNRASQVGQDLGLVLGRTATGTLVQAVDAFVAQPGMAEVALFFTSSGMAELLEAPLSCLAAGIRVLTVAETAAAPWQQDAAVARTLDETAKAHGSALLATGMNDVAMAQLPLTLAAMSRCVTRIESTTVASLDRLGAQTLAGMGIGAAPVPPAMGADADGEAAQGFSIAASVAEAMATLMGTHVRSLEVQVQPVLAETSQQLPALGLQIAPGQVCGMAESALARTVGGPELLVRLVGKVFQPGAREQVAVRVHGQPCLDMTLHPSGEASGFTEATAAIVLSRVASLLQAAPGLLTFDRLAAERYQVLPH